MNVLQLITSRRSFFDQQIRVLEARGVECTVASVPGTYTGDSARTPVDYVRFYPQILDQVRQNEYDLVHANYGLIAPFALAQPIRPIVLTLWGTDLMSEMGWLRQLSRACARRADAVIIPSSVMSRELDTEHIFIPFGIDLDLFRPISRRIAREYVGWEMDRQIALFPYDPTRTVKNFALAKRVVERARLDVELRSVDDVPYEEMPYYMNASDVLLVTSTRESGPMVVKEAASCNLPIVSTDVGFVRETIEGIENCAVCTSESGLVAALEYILEDGGPSNGRAAIDGLGLDEMGDRLLALYELVLGRTDETRPSLGTEGLTYGV